MIYALVALVFAAFFYGASLYFGLTENPGCAELASGAYGLSNRKPTLARGLVLQGVLALLSGGAGLVTWWVNGNGSWFFGGALMVIAGLWTLAAIMPSSHNLIAALQGGHHHHDAESTRALVVHRNERRAARSVVSLLALVSFAFGLAAL